jgi:hypothetical protein
MKVLGKMCERSHHGVAKDATLKLTSRVQSPCTGSVPIDQ